MTDKRTAKRHLVCKETIEHPLKSTGAPPVRTKFVYIFPQSKLNLETFHLIALVVGLGDTRLEKTR